MGFPFHPYQCFLPSQDDKEEAVKMVGRDNFDGESISDCLVAENVSAYYATKIVDCLNVMSKGGMDFYTVESNDHVCTSSSFEGGLMEVLSEHETRSGRRRTVEGGGPFLNRRGRGVLGGVG